MEVTFAQPARRHRVGRARARYVLDHPFLVVRRPAPAGSPLDDDRLVFLGDDQTGRALEVAAIETATGLHVIHVMDSAAQVAALLREGTGLMTDETPRTHSGVELTDELAERLADEAEAGYDLDTGQIVHVGRGRPSLSGDQTSPQVTFRLPGELRAKAEERAQREGKTLSALAREAMERYLAS